jgi:hypothetical protein
LITDMNEVIRCPECNENGLMRCPICDWHKLGFWRS